MPYYIDLIAESAIIHFHEEFSEAKLFDCRRAGSQWVTDMDVEIVGDWADFDHYQDVRWLCEEKKWEYECCPVCFAMPEGEFVETEKLQVVGFAEGCTGPDVFVTPDVGLARWKYLEWDENSDDNDLITWQEINVRRERGGP